MQKFELFEKENILKDEFEESIELHDNCLDKKKIEI